MLAEAPTEEAALPKLLQVLGGDMDWAVGAIWVPGEGGLLRCHLLWHAPGVEAPEFDRLTRELSLARGVGLPGLAWERKRPVTEAVTGERPVIARNEAAERAGLKAGRRCTAPRSRGAVATRLRRAIDEDELRVHFQPFVSLADGRVRGAEALVRWEHPDRGLLPPGAFIPVAERGPLILDVGSWVLRDACSQASRWRREHGDRAPLPVHVNIAARQIANEGLPRLIEAVLEETGLAAADLRLELTESALIEQLEPATAALEQLRELGVRTVLDDFGTGYSSLSLLQRLPVDGLKVDARSWRHWAARRRMRESRS